MTGTCLCGAKLVRTGNGRSTCSRPDCSGLPPAERPRPITPGDYAGWTPYVPPVADPGEQERDDDGDSRKWWT